MTYADTIKAAALVAARHAWSGLPDGLVRWQDEPQKQPDPKHPSIVLSTISHLSAGPVGLHQEVLTDGNLSRELSQLWYWTVQVKVESWRADVRTDLNPWQFAQRMRFGWKTLAAQRALDDLPAEKTWQTRHPVKLVLDPGDIRTITAPVSGHMLPQYIYEVELSYVEYDRDPETDGVIEHVDLEGNIGSESVEDLVQIVADIPTP